MIVKQLKLSQAEKEKLIRLKAKTGIAGWNVLCRWALCASLNDPAVPFGPEVPSDSNVEMSWQTFGGEYQEIYDAIMRERCKMDAIEDEPTQVARHFRLHLQRGINMLSSKTGPRNADELLAMACSSEV